MGGWDVELRQSGGGTDLVIRHSLQDDGRASEVATLSWV
jgi:hypothetical protein